MEGAQCLFQDTECSFSPRQCWCSSESRILKQAAKTHMEKALWHKRLEVKSLKAHDRNDRSPFASTPPFLVNNIKGPGLFLMLLLLRLWNPLKFQYASGILGALKVSPFLSLKLLNSHCLWSITEQEHTKLLSRVYFKYVFHHNCQIIKHIKRSPCKDEQEN